MNVVAFIFARGGSKGVPRKNLALLAGKPLLQHSIEAARACPRVNRVVVSTDDDGIAAAATELGAEVPFMRPPDLAADDSPEWLAWRHAIEAVDGVAGAEPIDVFLSVPTTAPFRCPQDLTDCVEKLLTTDADIVVTVTETTHHPMFNMVCLDDNGRARLATPPAEAMTGRQQVPYKVYDMTTVGYAARPEYILRAKSLFAGTVAAVVIPQERALDIDTPFDLELARCIARINHGD